MDFETVKYNYEHKLWNIQLVKIAVQKGIITKCQYKEITGFTYPNVR